jgi:tetratricopeptide (TPR) repeat protein
MAGMLNKTRTVILAARDGLSWVLFTLVLWFLIGALVWLFVSELLKKAPNSTLLVAVAGLLLVVILFNRYESVFVGRLKKIGPLELFEEARDLFADFDEIALNVPLVGSPVVAQATPRKLTLYEAFHCQQGDVAISLLEFTKSQPEKSRHRDKYFDLLCKIGSCAAAQNDWARATARLDRLRELSADSFRPEIVLPTVGISYLYWALEDRSETRKEWLVKAVEAFAKVIKSGGTSYLNYFHLAYAQDDLGLCHEAIESNKEALKRRPDFAPAKYNAAVSYVKLGDFRSAYDSLTQIGRQDTEAMKTLKSAFIDEELRPLREHEEWESKVALFLAQMTSKA